LPTRISGCRKRRTWPHGDGLHGDDGGRVSRSPQDPKRREGGLSGRATQSLVTYRKAALMSQRESGYQRKLLDQYETPAWVTLALIPHLPEFIGKIWEPACGSGKMVAALRQAGFDVVGSDITQGVDFLSQAPETGVSAVITNPPYALARQFIERALYFDDTRIVAMLLRTDFDHAASRAHLFADCAMFAKKVVLTKRIRWFEDSVGSPSFNHCWMIWDRQHHGPPTLAYASDESCGNVSFGPHCGLTWHITGCRRSAMCGRVHRETGGR
jgi:hypothetical protein